MSHKVRKRKIFSPSRINLFKKCPRKYYYDDKGLIVPAVDSTPALLGRSVHRGIKNYYDSLRSTPTLKEINAVGEKSFNDAWDSRLSNRLRRDLKLLLANFLKFEEWRLKNEEKPFKPEVCEEDLTSSKFHAFPDWFHGGRLIDWKTGRNPNITEDLQLEMWVQAEILTFLGYKVDSIQLVFLRFNKFVNLPPPNFAWLYEQRQTVIDSIRANYFPPNVSILCHYCHYKLICEYSPAHLKVPLDEPIKMWTGLETIWDQKIIPQRITHIPEW